MARQPGTLSTIWRNIKHTLSVARAKEVHVGTDVDGNKYYERPADSAKNIRLQRRVESANGDTWNAPEVPTEWLAWLRSRRQQPPTPEEIERNYGQMIRTQRRAGELDRIQQNQTERDGRENLPTQPQEDRSFPKYDEFESEPGEFRKPKR